MSEPNFCKWPGCALAARPFTCEPHWEKVPSKLRLRLRKTVPKSAKQLRAIGDLMKWANKLQRLEEA